MKVVGGKAKKNPFGATKPTAGGDETLRCKLMQYTDFAAETEKRPKSSICLLNAPERPNTAL